LNEASDAAERIGVDRTDHQSTFGPAKVAMLGVDVAIVQDDFTGALSAARAVPRDAALPLAARARHLADIALAQLRLGHGEKALSTLLAMEHFAPDWIKYQTLPREICAELVEHEARRSTPLRELAIRLGALS
jgi:hypothetical protein